MSARAATGFFCRAAAIDPMLAAGARGDDLHGHPFGAQLLPGAQLFVGSLPQGRLGRLPGPVGVPRWLRLGASARVGG